MLVCVCVCVHGERERVRARVVGPGKKQNSLQGENTVEKKRRVQETGRSTNEAYGGIESRRTEGVCGQ